MSNAVIVFHKPPPPSIKEKSLRDPPVRIAPAAAPGREFAAGFRALSHAADSARFFNAGAIESYASGNLSASFCNS